MAVPTHSNTKSTTVENMGVPVLFSIKNVQPLILAAKPATDLGRHHSDAANQTIPNPGVTTSAQPSVANDSPLKMVSPTMPSETAPKARRTSLLSKVVATSFVVMLVVVVIRFSVPGPKPAGDVAESSASTINESSTNTASSIVTGPESSSQNQPPKEPEARLASLPVSPSLELGTPVNEAKTNAPEAPALPPLLTSTSSSSGTSNNSGESQFFLQPPVAAPSELATPILEEEPPLESKKLAIPTSFPATDPAKQHPFANAPQPQTQQPVTSPESSTSGDLNVLDTLTPERSLAEFEWLFRNATKNPVIPYRPVSAGGHEGASSQSMPTQAPTNSSAELNALNGNNSPVPSQGASGYQPLTLPASEAIPPYERNNPNQLVNRYQQRIKQPQRSPTQDPSLREPSTAPMPYQPIVPQSTAQPNSGAMSVGYPPVQYTPTTITPTPNNSLNSSPVQNNSLQNSPGQR